MYCHKCGVKLNEGSQFCHACGTKVVNVSEQVEQFQQPITPVQTQTPVQSYTPEPVVEKKGTPFVVIGWVAFGLSLVSFMSPIALPIIFGLIALIMGILVINVRSRTHGLTLALLAVAGSLLSMAIGHAVKTVIAHYYYYF